MNIEKHNCFISFKKEDKHYKEKIEEKLTKERVKGKSLDKTIESDDIDYVMQVIRNEYMNGTSVTIFLIGEHSSENEGFEYSEEDKIYYNKQNFIIRELKATLYDGPGNRRSGLLGVVLPEMYDKIYSGSNICPKCGDTVTYVNINDATVIKEFSKNYYLKKSDCDHYGANGRYCIAVRYDDFMYDPDKYINMAYDKTNQDIANYVHWKDIDHIYEK